MKIATGTQETPYGSMAGAVDLDSISYRGRGEHAERKHRQIIELLWASDTLADVIKTLDDHTYEIDAIYFEYPDYADAIKEAANEVKDLLTFKDVEAGSAPAIPAIAQSEPPKQGKTLMFATNTIEGSKGPWMTWTSNGSAAKGFAPKSWVIRGKDENENKFEQVFEGFENPCVFDLDSLKLGWEKDGAAGTPPDRRYSSHYSVAMPRPDDSKKTNNAFVWSNCLQVRVATSQTQAVTWEQGSFGAYEAFTHLARLIEVEWSAKSQNGALLPVVQMAGVETRHLKGGDSNIPILKITNWVPRPDILKDDAPAIATAPAAPAAQPAPAAPTPEPAAPATPGGF